MRYFNLVFLTSFCVMFYITDVSSLNPSDYEAVICLLCAEDSLPFCIRTSINLSADFLGFPCNKCNKKMLRLLKILLSLNILTAFCSCLIQNDFTFKKIETGINGSVILTKQVSSSMQCGVMCFNLPLCFVFSVKKDDNATHCVLLKEFYNFIPNSTFDSYVDSNEMKKSLCFLLFIGLLTLLGNAVARAPCYDYCPMQPSLNCNPQCTIGYACCYVKCKWVCIPA